MQAAITYNNGRLAPKKSEGCVTVFLMDDDTLPQALAVEREESRQILFGQRLRPFQHGVPRQFWSSIGRYYAELAEVIREPLRHLFW